MAWLLGVAGACADGGPMAGGEALPTGFSPREHYARIHAGARDRRHASAQAVQPAWEYGRACFDLAEHAVDDDERERLGLEGAAACREALARDPDSAPAHYFLALNLGQVAKTRLLGALKLVRQMESAFLESARLDAHFDFAGAHRSLGILYRDAPGWPTSIGDRRKSRHHLEEAARLEPGYPGNQLALAESRLRWGELHAVQPALHALTNGWTTNRVRLAGPDWHTSWVEWHQRRTRVEQALRR